MRSKLDGLFKQVFTGVTIRTGIFQPKRGKYALAEVNVTISEKFSQRSPWMLLEAGLDF